MKAALKLLLISPVSEVLVFTVCLVQNVISLQLSREWLGCFMLAVNVTSNIAQT